MSRRPYLVKMRAALRRLRGGGPAPLRTCAPSKIARKGERRAFSLPARVTCPGATATCEATCYAMKGRHVFQGVIEPQAANLATLRELRSAEAMAPALAAALPQRLYFRIHHSGDFYSQAYLDAWVATIRARPDVMFWAYTRSFKLDFAEASRLPNLQLFASIDDDNRAAAQAFRRRYGWRIRAAYGPMMPGQTIPPRALVCPVGKHNDDETAPEHCGQCGHCFEPPTTAAPDVAFPLH